MNGIISPARKRTAANAWIDRVNPLHGLTIQQAKTIFDVARAHGSPLLQKIYDEIEMTDPVLMTCVERRQSALSGLGWRALANASASDAALAEEQRRALEAFAAAIGNLDEAIEHLDLAFFRGYSVVQPVWDTPTAVGRIILLNSWNFLKGDDGRLLWNPDCTLDPKGCVEITPSARIAALVRRRAIDWPALTIFIRKYVGERDWGRFIERYGIPPVDAVMGPNTTDEQRADYLECAEAAKEGRVVVWPSGTTSSRAEGSRGQDPFTAFIEHQEKLIVLMATGGTLTSLAQADTGSLAGGAQMDVWDQIVQRDGVAISGVLNRALFAPFLRAAFPGRPVLARFEIGRDEEPSAAEAADLAGKIRAAGYTVAQDELEEATGFTLEREEAQPSGQFPLPGAHLTNKKNDIITPETKSGSEANGLLEAFAKDSSAAAEAVKKLLENPSPAAAAALLKDLPSLLPDDPAMAAIIAEEMAKEFGAVKLENSITNPCPKCHRQMTKDGTCSFCAKRAANHEAGKSAFDEVAKTHKDKIGAMERDSIGKIDFIWGDDTEGICHILGKHLGDAQMIPGVIAYGDIYEDTVNGKYYVVKKRNLVVLRKREGVNHYLITGYQKDDPKAIAKIRKEYKLVEKGE